jgi:hypothetical protein
MNNVLAFSGGGAGINPAESNPWAPIADLCDNLVDRGAINRMESAILRRWIQADRWSGNDRELARIDYLVSILITGGHISDEERRELGEWLNNNC